MHEFSGLESRLQLCRLKIMQKRWWANWATWLLSVIWLIRSKSRVKNLFHSFFCSFWCKTPISRSFCFCLESKLVPANFPIGRFVPWPQDQDNLCDLWKHSRSCEKEANMHVRWCAVPFQAEDSQLRAIRHWYGTCWVCLICDLVTINQQMLVSFVRLTAPHHAARGFDTCLQHPVMCLSPVRHPSDVKCSFLHVFVTSWPHSHGRKYFCGNSIEWHRKSTLTPMPQLLLGSCTQRGSRRSTHDWQNSHQ